MTRIHVTRAPCERVETLDPRLEHLGEHEHCDIAGWFQNTVPKEFRILFWCSGRADCRPRGRLSGQRHSP